MCLNIGYVLCGEVPLGRGKTGDNTVGGDEWYPLCGWTGHHDYTGFLPHAHLPKALDPTSGRIVSSNHRLVDYNDYPHWLGLIFKNSSRARAIHEELDRLEGKPHESAVTHCNTLQHTAAHSYSA